jgi:WhiB family redox-sensing transcriptional regulator
VTVYMFDGLDIPGDWDDSALCAQTDAAPFFPDGRGTTCSAAKKICAACPVTVECLTYALDYESRFDTPAPEGVYGGLAPRERARLIAVRRGRKAS